MRAIKLAFVLSLLFVAQGVALARARKLDFWNAQRKGANYHNHVPSREWWIAAREAGIEVVITTVSLPGSRWRQQNNEKDDLRIWWTILS